VSVELQTAGGVQVSSAPPAGTPAAPRRRRRLDIRRDAKWLFGLFGVLMLINLLVWVLFVGPRREEITELQRRKMTAHATEKDADKKLAALRQLNQRVELNQQAIKSFYADMLSTKRQRMVGFQRAVARVGQEFDCEPERVAVGVSELENEGIEALALTFPISSGYDTLRQFLSRLESLDQFLIVREVQLAGAKEGGSDDLQLNVVVETYFDAPGIREEKERQRADKLKNRRQGARRTNARPRR
jgi:Tfp pilus assembly protein PilO